MLLYSRRGQKADNPDSCCYCDLPLMGSLDAVAPQHVLIPTGPPLWRLAFTYLHGRNLVGRNGAIETTLKIIRIYNLFLQSVVGQSDLAKLWACAMCPWHPLRVIYAYQDGCDIVNLGSRHQDRCRCRPAGPHSSVCDPAGSREAVLIMPSSTLTCLQTSFSGNGLNVYRCSISLLKIPSIS
jgi:hypothetical protein